jgi:preprotein translocase subunit SecD
LAVILLTVISAVIALPEFTFRGKTFHPRFELKQGLDIQGGMQVLLQADMSQIAPEDRTEALAAAKEVMLRRVDLFGISEPLVQTSEVGDQYRIIVELPGVDDPNQALQLIGTTAELDFRLLNQDLLAGDEATISAVAIFDSFEPTGITGKQLKRATVQFGQDQTSNAGQPVVAIEFDAEGSEIFRQVTTDHTGEMLAIFLDDIPLMTPVIQTPIANGQAVITGDFSLDEARNLSIQLNAGALPVPIEVLQQRNIGASLGQQSVADSVQAGLIGLGLVMLFMILYYGVQGFLASLGLIVYSLITIALYKTLGVTLTLPGIAGLILSIGMAVDANILIFERMKEELRDGKPFSLAMELGFGRAWDSIKDANLATILTALVLINPLDFPFLNTSGLVRGFGITLFIGVVISLFTGVVVTRTLMRLFLKPQKEKRT